MSRMTGRFGRQARLALEHQRLLRWLPRGAQEQVRESRVRFIGARCGKGDLEGRHQLQIEQPVAQVAQLDFTELDVVFRADPDRAVRVELGPGGVEADPVGVVGALVVRGGVGRRMLRDRHRLRLAIPAQVNEASVRIAKQVVACARNADLAPTAPACAVGTQRHAVAAVRKQVRRRERGHAGHEFAQHARGAALARVGRRAGRRREQQRNLARRALVKQRAHGFDVRVGHAPAARRAVEQHVGNRDDAHALVVRHKGVDTCEALGRGLPAGAEIERLDEAVAGARRELLHAREIGHGEVRRDLRRERRRIRRDHQFVDRRSPQRRARHALRRVLVGQCVVARGVGRFRNAPRHVLRVAERHLLADRRLAGVAQHAALRLVEHQRGHQVLEHRSRPRAQPGIGADRIERPAERGPVVHRHIALGDGEQAGQARFGGEQVVEARVELLLGDAKADVKQVALAVVQKSEICGPCERLAACGKLMQAVHRVVGDRNINAGADALRLCSGRGSRIRIDERAAQGGEVIGRAPREQVERRRRERGTVVRQQRAYFIGRTAQQAVEPLRPIRHIGDRVGQGEQAL